MFQPTSAFSGFSVDDSAKAREFYSEVLGLEVINHGYGTNIQIPGGSSVFFYPKGTDHIPATYTILNFVVDDIDSAVDALTQQGIVFDHGQYSDEKGIQRGIAAGRGPDQAWFKDPAGNILSVLKLA